MIKKESIYMHRTKEENFELEELCENDEAKRDSLYIGYEVKIEGEFNTQTGKFSATKFGGVKLKRPVEI